MNFPLNAVIIVVNLILIQLLGAYLRYLPFSRRMTEEEVQNLWTRFFAVSALLFCVDIFIFYNFKLSPFFYKLTFIFALSSYFFVSVATIKEKFLYHIFVLGMQGIWALILHAMAATVNSFFKDYFLMNEILGQGIFFLIFFVLFWKIERDFFLNLFSTRYIFEKYFQWYDALLPFVIFIGLFLQMTDDILIQPFKERIVRFFIPVFFFVMYRSINILQQQSEKKNRQQSFNGILHYQLQNLREYNLIIQDNQKQIAVLRHDLRHNYRLITAMLKEGKIQKAIEHLQAQIQSLSNNEPQNLEAQSILHAVISTYQNKTEKLRIKITVEIQPPSVIFFNESDVAILLSNLFDNAINAELNQPPNAREIFFKLYQLGNKNFFEISNRVNFNFAPNENEIPFQKRGTGMNALINFKKLYDAQLNFNQIDGWLKISVSWNSSPEPETNAAKIM